MSTIPRALTDSVLNYKLLLYYVYYHQAVYDIVREFNRLTNILQSFLVAFV